MTYFLIWFVMVMKMFRQAMVVFLKEMKCIVRDTKTFLLGLLMPLILVPGLLFIVNLSLGSMFPDNSTAAVAKVYCDNKDNSFYKFLSSQSQVKMLDVNDQQKSLNSGEIDVAIRVDSSLDDVILKGGDVDFENLIKEEYNSTAVSNASAKASMAKYKIYFKQIIEGVREGNALRTGEDLMRAVSIDTDESTAGVMENLSDIKVDINLICFALLVPSMIILYSGTSSMGTATELGVGEKERGTLESLLSTGANRTSIVLGKLFATTAMGTMGGLCAVLGLWAYMQLMFGQYASQLTLLGGLYLAIITICIACFFSSVYLMLSIYSKSNKESQTYSLPIVMIFIAPTFFAYGLNPVDIDMLKLSIPVYNVACVLKEILASSANLAHLLVVCGWLMIYSLIAVAVMIRLFKKESIIFRV